MSLLCRVLVLTTRKQCGARPRLLARSQRVILAKTLEQSALHGSPPSLSFAVLRALPLAIALHRVEAVFLVHQWPAGRNDLERDCYDRSGQARHFVKYDICLPSRASLKVRTSWSPDRRSIQSFSLMVYSRIFLRWGRSVRSDSS